MKAMILAAGRGERMRPLTDHLPKPLLSAGGRPLIAWHLQRLARAGIRDVVINHAWLGEKIEQALGDGSAWDVRIRYSAEGTALETAGGIARAMPMLTAPAAPGSASPAAPLQPGQAQGQPAAGFTDEEPFLVVSGDTFCDFDYGRAHTIALQMRQARLACWLVMVPNPPHHTSGDFELADGLLGVAPAAGEDRHRCPGAVAPGARRPPLTYAGIGLYTPRMFSAVQPGEKSPLRPWLEREIAAGRAAGEYHGGLWFDIGTAQRLAELDRLIATQTHRAGA